MKTKNSVFTALLLLVWFMPALCLAQSTGQVNPDLQQDLASMKKADKQMKYSISKCGREIKALKQHTDENIKKLNDAFASLTVAMDTLDARTKVFMTDVNKKQDQLSASVRNTRLTLWVLFIVLLLAFLFIYFRLSGLLTKMKASFEARQLNEKEAFELAIKKLDKELAEITAALEQRIAELKK